MSETNTALKEAANLAAPFEGFSARPYPDIGGVWTIGYGSTHDYFGRPVTDQTPAVNKPQALQMMMRDMRAALQQVTAAVHVPLTANEEAALADLVYNVGIGNVDGSALMRKLNAGDYAAAAAYIDSFDHAGARVVSGLLRRREAETDLFCRRQPMPGHAAGNLPLTGNEWTARLNAQEAAIGTGAASI